MLVPLSSRSLLFSVLTAPFLEWAELSLCAASVPAALKLKFTFFVDTVHLVLAMTLGSRGPAWLLVRQRDWHGSALHTTLRTLSTPCLKINAVQIATFQCFELPQWVMEHLYLMYILDNFYTFLTHIHVLSLPSPAPSLLNSSYPQTATQPGWAKKNQALKLFLSLETTASNSFSAFHSSSFPGWQQWVLSSCTGYAFYFQCPNCFPPSPNPQSKTQFSSSVCSWVEVGNE